MKKCCTCKIDKPFEEFSRSARTGFRSECKSCAKIKGKIYYENNKSKILAKTKEYYKNNKDRYRKWCSDWDKRNPEKSKSRYLRYRHSNVELCRERDRQYRLKNLDKDACKTMRRKAAKLQRTPKWLSFSQIQEIEGFYVWAQTLSRMTGILHHVDHIVPLRGRHVSGLHVPWNLQVLPASENLRKRNKFNIHQAVRP